MEVVCPVAGKPGTRVLPVTVRSLVRNERASEIEGREWFYCDLPDCKVVYLPPIGKRHRYRRYSSVLDSRAGKRYRVVGARVMLYPPRRNFITLRVENLFR